MLAILLPADDDLSFTIPARVPRAGPAPGLTILGRAGGDTLRGLTGNDVISGFAGDDTIAGGSGDDALSGGAGGDRISGGHGSDVIYGNEGQDRIAGGAGGDFAAGGEGDDVIFGGGGKDRLSGADGDDFIDGGGGDDIIAGDVSDSSNRGDIADGGAGRDTLTFARCASAVFADLAYGSDVLGNMDGAAVDVNDALIVNIEDLAGTVQNDYLAGDEQENSLTGLEGDDMLFGRAGADRLTGALGADTFVYGSAAEGGDTIRDFEHGSDHILLSSDGFGGIGLATIALAFQRSKSGDASGDGPKLVLQTQGEDAGHLFFDANGGLTGGRTLIASITFASATGLSDFGEADFAFA
jgi:Ca2+-binding RTX toxin-like protein